MDVGAVVVGQGEGRLELAREVGLAVDRLDRVVAGGRDQDRAGRGQRVVDLLAVEPDVPVARRPRGAVRGQAVGVGLQLRRGRRRGSGAGQQRTFRSTSPQAARVESRRLVDRAGSSSAGPPSGRRGAGTPAGS